VLFGGRKATGDRNAALEKEGKLFVQVMYPDNSFTDGVSFTTLYIKVVQYKGGWVMPVWYCNNICFTAAFNEVLNSTKDVDLGSEWLNYVIKFMVEAQTRDSILMGLICKNFAVTSGM
jgi:predicted YcjX-like family ATPase